MSTEQDDDLEEFGLSGVVRETGRAETTELTPDEEEGIAGLPRHDSFRGLVEKAFNAHDSKLRKALAAQIAKRSPVIQKLPPPKTGYIEIEFGPVVVPPHGRITSTTHPLRLFRAEKIINTGDVGDLRISGLFVGSRPQLTPGALIPVDAFNNSLGEICLDTCQPNEGIAFEISNMSAMTATWSTTVVGRVVL